MKFIYRYPEAHGTAHDMLDAGPVARRRRPPAGGRASGAGCRPSPGSPAARRPAATGHQTLDPFAALPFAAAATSRIRLLTYLCVLAVHRTAQGH